MKNVPESNGKVGILGISYDGFLPLMALVDPHPALKVSVPMNPMVDGWIGDDWFHNGAFRQINVTWIYDQVATRKGEAKWWTSHHDVYDMFMQAGSAGELGRRRGLDQLGFWRKLTEHPAYDAFWREQAVDKLLAERPLKVPVMLVHSLWDQEDIYGAPAVYKAIEPKDTDNDKVFLVMGPWYHGQMIADGSALGALKFGTPTRRWSSAGTSCAPFLAQYLKDGAPKADIAPVTAFETGTNAWRRLPAWPPKAGKADGGGEPTPLYLRSGLKLSFDAPAAGDAAFEEYVSDPAKPVPFRARPIQPMGYARGQTWSRWLVDDQREASGRPDVLAFVSDVLTEPMKIAGEPVANLVASTSGSDSDWVVKLIDVYPDEVAGQAEMGGYQLMVAADIFRGRYRESFETAKAIAPDTAARVPIRPAHGQPRLPAGAPDHGAGPVELVPAVRPQSPDLRAQHLLGQASGLREGHPAGLPRTRPHELRGTARRPLIVPIRLANSCQRPGGWDLGQLGHPAKGLPPALDGRDEFTNSIRTFSGHC